MSKGVYWEVGPPCLSDAVYWEVGPPCISEGVYCEVGPPCLSEGAYWKVGRSIQYNSNAKHSVCIHHLTPEEFFYQMLLQVATSVHDVLVYWVNCIKK